LSDSTAGGERTDEAVGELSLDLPAAHSAVRMARQVVRQFARSKGIEDGELEVLVLVTSELLANAVDHGGGRAAMFQEDLHAPVRMQLALKMNGRGWTLEVTDHGGGDPDDVQELLAPTGIPDLEDERGRGFFLLAQMVELSVLMNESGDGLILRAVRHRGGA
jgi:anti-sigma regulatory factor (Ser/Thr protein kinase)